MMRAVIFLISVIFLFSYTLNAEDITWTGAKDNSWRNHENWSTGKVPGPEDKAIIPSGTPECKISSDIQVGEINNSGTIHIINQAHITSTCFIYANKLDNSGLVRNDQTSLHFRGVNDGKVEINNSGYIESDFNLSVWNGSAITNSGNLFAKSIHVESDVFKNTSGSSVSVNGFTSHSNDFRNYGNIFISCRVDGDGVNVDGNSFINTGNICMSFSGPCDPTVYLTFKNEFENYPSGEISITSRSQRDPYIKIISPKFSNYGEITGFKSITDKSRTDSIPSGTIMLIGESIYINFKPNILAEKIILVFHKMVFEKVDTMHILKAISAIEFRGDRNSVFHAKMSYPDMLYSPGGNILILTDTILSDWNSIEDLCDPDPVTGPSDTSYISGHISSNSVIDSSGSSGTFWVYLLNQGTCHKAFDYSITSPDGWITPVNGTTQVLSPFQFDSLEIQYSIPSKPLVKTEAVLQTFSVSGLFADTSYSYITVTDSVDVGIEQKQWGNNGFFIAISPNPFSEYCRIVSNRDAEIFINDLFGRLVLETFAMKDKAIDWYPACETGSGCYLVLARCGNQYSSKKVFFVK